MDQALLRKYQMYIVPAIAGVIGIGVLIFVVFIARSIPEINTNIGDKRVKTQALNQKKSQLDGINTNEYKEQLETAMIILPTDQEMPGAFNQLVFLLRTNNLNLNEISFASAKPPAPNKLDEYSVKIGITGEPANIEVFINKLKESPRIMRISAIEANTVKDSVKIQAAVDLTTFFQGAPKALGSVTQQVNIPQKSDTQILEELKKYIQTSTPEAQTNFTGKTNPFE